MYPVGFKANCRIGELASLIIDEVTSDEHDHLSFLASQVCQIVLSGTLLSGRRLVICLRPTVCPTLPVFVRGLWIWHHPCLMIAQESRGSQSLVTTFQHPTSLHTGHLF